MLCLYGGNKYMTDYYGLTTDEVKKRKEIYGYNEIRTKRKKRILRQVRHILSEPIYLLLSCSSAIYFLLGERTEGGVMIAFVIFVIGIDVFQEVRTGIALKKLKEITTPEVTVIRDGIVMQIPGRELVPGDLMFIAEGVKIPADGYLLRANGLCIDESILTGEAESVWKNARVNINEIESNENYVHNEYFKRDYCYTGTFVIVGTGTVLVERTGNHTEYGKIADSILKAPETNTVLQIQMKKLAKQCSVFAAILFLLVGFFTFFNLSGHGLMERIIHSMLAGVVLALSMIPGEFPVILSVFLSMGALRLAKKKALIRHLPSVETLGLVSVLCMDKTGTITQNKMQVSDCFINKYQKGKFCRTMALAHKEGTYDPVEKAIMEYGEYLCSQCRLQSDEVKACSIAKRNSLLIKEYPFTNELRAMGQVWMEGESYTIAAKGSPETILSLCYLTNEQDIEVKERLNNFLKKGLRVIAFADRTLGKDFDIPDNLSQCRLHLRGILGLSDPARKEIKDNISACYDAGIRVVMITGDHKTTASVIAGDVGINNSKRVITGDEITRLSDLELGNVVKECNIYARVLPLHKMRIVKALQENGEVVAMTGDGVNDSPALKIADIGIAMGKHGSEICREAADLILLDDNISTILNTVHDGRRIYQNIMKTVGYVLAIHVPIALISLVAPMLGIVSEALMLLPLHIVLLEMIMDPTCSIALERLPAEDNIMKIPPRKKVEHLLTKGRLMKSVLQGLVIFMFSFGIYYIMVRCSYSPELARTAGFAVLVLSNVLLVLENCSESENIIQIIRKIGKDRGIWTVNVITICGLMLLIYTPLNKILGFHPLSVSCIILVIVLSIISVLWYEIVKIMKN
jgi:Ca2+-transporting ATPase